MAKSRLFVENFCNRVVFPGHEFLASSAVDGREAFRVGTGRREVRNFWTPEATNTDAWVGVRCDQPRAADMIAIDRNSNLRGRVVRLEASQDAFATSSVVFELTVPETVLPGSRLAESPGALTEEKAWLFHFPAQVARYWRLFIPAMGVGQRPEVGGLYLGLSYGPTEYLDLPYDDGAEETRFEEVISEDLWAGSSRPASRRYGQLNLKLGSYAEYDLARYHVSSLFQRRKPMWIIHDQDQAERAVLATTPEGQHGMPQESGWGYRQARVSWVEHLPARPGRR